MTYAKLNFEMEIMSHVFLSSFYPGKIIEDVHFFFLFNRK